MSLPLPWVDRIFEKLTLVYGQAFLARWRDVNLMAVKSDWAHELAGFAPKDGEVGSGSAGAAAIAYALANLDPDAPPPNVLQFRALARRAPAPEAPRLPEPKADPSRVAAELAKLKPIAEAVRTSTVDGRDWARLIVSRAAHGEAVNRTSLLFARQALGVVDAWRAAA